MPVVQEMKELEVLDFGQGLERLRGNRELYGKLLNEFSEHYRDCCFEIENALFCREREKAHRLVHNLKGLAGNLAAMELYEASRALDKKLKESDPDWTLVDKRYCDFKNAFERALNSADRLAKVYGATRKAVVVPENVPQRLAPEVARSIRDAIRSGDIMAIVELSESPLLDRVLQTQIAVLADDLDFEGLSRLADEFDRLSERSIVEN